MEFHLSVGDQVMITLAALSILLFSLIHSLEGGFCLPHLRLSGKESSNLPVFQNLSS